MPHVSKYFFLIVILSSCGASHSILIKTDGSAIVQSMEYTGDSLKMVKSPMITDFGRKNDIFEFKINNIDSMGNYMGDIFNSGYFNFKYYADSLVICNNNNLPLRTRWDKWYCCGYTMTMTSDKPIVAVRSKSKGVRFKKQKVYLLRTLKHSRTKPTRMTIIFGK
jgi:hypothetical protein